MSPISPVHPVTIDQPQVRLIDECGGLKSVAGPLSRHVSSRQPPQFFIDDGRQAVERDPVTRAPGEQQSADFDGRPSAHVES